MLTAILTGVSLITTAESARDDDFACPMDASRPLSFAGIRPRVLSDARPRHRSDSSRPAACETLRHRGVRNSRRDGSFGPRLPRLKSISHAVQEHVETDISLQQVREAAEGHHPGPVLGLYVGTLRYRIEIDDTIRQLARDRFCATPKYVSLTVQHDRAIHIPREFVGDPCLAALARDHEAAPRIDERWEAGSNENLRVRARRTHDRRVCSSQTR